MLGRGGWTKVLQYEEDPYAPTTASSGMFATEEVSDGKMTDVQIDLIGGPRTLVNTGTIIGGTQTSLTIFDIASDQLPLSAVSGRYVGFSIQVGSETRMITSYTVTLGSSQPVVGVSPGFTLPPSNGQTYQIYSVAKEYLLFGLSFTGQTDDAEEPVYKLYLRSPLSYVDTAYGQGILSDTGASAVACVEASYADCSWTYFVSPGRIDTNLFGLPANTPGAIDDCDRIVTDVSPNYCLGHFYDSVTFVQASQTERCFISGACGVGQTIGKGVRLMQVQMFVREYEPAP